MCRFSESDSLLKTSIASATTYSGGNKDDNAALGDLKAETRTLMTRSTQMTTAWAREVVQAEELLQRALLTTAAERLERKSESQLDSPVPLNAKTRLPLPACYPDRERLQQILSSAWKTAEQFEAKAARTDWIESRITLRKQALAIHRDNRDTAARLSHDQQQLSHLRSQAAKRVARRTVKIVVWTAVVAGTAYAAYRGNEVYQEQQKRRIQVVPGAR